jgi:hypothetical protein
VSDRLKASEIRKYEGERGWASAALPLWLLVTTHTAYDAARGTDSWVWPVWSLTCALYAALAWWHYRDLLKRHDAARSGT